MDANDKDRTRRTDSSPKSGTPTGSGRQPRGRARPAQGATPSGAEAQVAPAREHHGTGTVAGTVDASGGGGLAQVRIVLGLVGGGGRLAFADTDDGGEFTFTEVEPGRYTVGLDEVPTVLDEAPWRPRAGDTGERPVEVAAYETARADPIVLEPVPVSGAVGGFVLDVTGGTGLGGVLVALVPAGASTPVPTDGSGQFEFPAVLPGQY
ncbi:MAG TPA: hypothetical protein VF486_08360, partial [Actinomycetes bacterium]